MKVRDIILLKINLNNLNKHNKHNKHNPTHNANDVVVSCRTLPEIFKS